MDPPLPDLQWLEAKCTIAWSYLVHGYIWTKPIYSSNPVIMAIPLSYVVCGESRNGIGWALYIGSIQRHEVEEG